MIKDQLIFSRSFSDPITDRVGMEQVMGIYAHRASARLHKHQKAGQDPLGVGDDQLLQPAPGPPASDHCETTRTHG
ncbi:hypothetical protein [Glutamicibacter ardleyensis]|uniref:Uncharacterized protein n=1 Tax=Glutamicibacter ardleyensis TaxID=225894 RepID=A0ABQ2DD20_9MICC|nr:hypothetical protein [Glutamicibacter ardleyensis]GGJ53804.1 hypothetical protein GCM10007173_10440 [Glutamicibacter ardleyensis]